MLHMCNFKDWLCYWSFYIIENQSLEELYIQNNKILDELTGGIVNE